MISGSLRLDTGRGRPLFSPTDEQLYRFALVWRVRTTTPPQGQPAEWDCFQATGWWWEEPRGTIQLFSQFCWIGGCDEDNEAIVASSADFGRGTTLQSSRFNGGVTGTFVKQ